MADITSEIKKRRTFAIISHPDAGKTTLTEKFLLYGGAINLAGSVKGKKTAKHAVSDWMEIEKERGISVTSSVLQFPKRLGRRVHGRKLLVFVPLQGDGAASGSRKEDIAQVETRGMASASHSTMLLFPWASHSIK